MNIKALMLAQCGLFLAAIRAQKNEPGRKFRVDRQRLLSKAKPLRALSLAG
ncbi:hypothetical protein [Agrobacterium larrymoorei]|uniref:Uncharacterized protein n=1 Tax=Agrobacterium larrymoorei TaxID=160699 RepID=A0AAF0HF54_9HYPH|nr:hypothetical protein [Agrobacterium larrymoorei]WHA43640.1 hypothetical protein CFBP5477_020685 [Agrobacterium larrymoorei]